MTGRRGVTRVLRLGLRALLAFGLSTAAILAGAGSATAVSGTPVTAGVPNQDDIASVAVDASGTAYVAWRRQFGGTTGDLVQYCVLPVGASACAHSGNLQPADGPAGIDGLSVIADGGTIVVLADVLGTQGSMAADYQPEQEWQSSDGGATFNPVGGGLSVASASLSADTGPNNAIILPGTNVLGMGWTTAGDVPTFNAFPLSSPPECSKAMCGQSFARLEPNTEPAISNVAGHLASEAGAHPGVLAVYEGAGAPPLECTGQDTITYAYGAGNQGTGNSYNLSPGQPGSAWQVPVSRAVCNAKFPADGGGASGFGLLADNEANGTTSYWRFDQAHSNFDLPPVTVSRHGQIYPSVGQDGAGGIYATFLDGGIGGPLALAYSGDGGATWLGPEPIVLNPDGHDDHVSSAVGPSGQGWIVWTHSGSILAQPFVKSDADPTPTTLVTVQTSGSHQAPSLTIGAGTTGETDRATVAGQNGTSAGGTVHYALYSDPSCKTKVFDGGTHPVAGGLAAGSNPVTSTLTPGTYYWQAGYSGDGLNQPSTSACTGEVLTVSASVSAGGSGTSTSTTVTITVTCSSLPCTVTVTITVTIGSAPDLGATVARRRTITLGSARVTLRRRGAQRVVIRLSSAGRRYLNSHHGQVRARLSLTVRAGRQKLVRSRTIKIAPARRHRR